MSFFVLPYLSLPSSVNNHTLHFHRLFPFLSVKKIARKRTATIIFFPLLGVAGKQIFVRKLFQHTSEINYELFQSVKLTIPVVITFYLFSYMLDAYIISKQRQSYKAINSFRLSGFFTPRKYASIGRKSQFPMIFKLPLYIFIKFSPIFCPKKDIQNKKLSKNYFSSHLNFFTLVDKREQKSKYKHYFFPPIIPPLIVLLPCLLHATLMFPTIFHAYKKIKRYKS